ncbi:MAG: hypothetical protein RML35_05710 [Chloroherpetonaceae bacterium]|nr:hypothetical protein [Chloroherpetonaceae bacterium]
MLRFEKKLNVTPDNLEELSEVQRAQLFNAYPKWFGKAPKSIEDMFITEGEAGIAHCEFYQVYENDEDSEPKYDVWIVNVEMGAVYESGTVLDTGIGMAQHYFQALESDDKELAHELHAAFVRYVQQSHQQKPAPEHEEEQEARALAEALTEEIINGRSKELPPATPATAKASRAASKKLAARQSAAAQAKKKTAKKAVKASSGKVASPSSKRTASAKKKAAPAARTKASAKSTLAKRQVKQSTKSAAATKQKQSASKAKATRLKKK